MESIQEREERMLKFWDDQNIFQRSMDERRTAQPFVFFEGPPTANGNPGMHHFIGRVFKDLVCRYQTMRGRYVLRKGGWDTHGLPVELQVEKELGFKSKKDIEAYGVAAYNKKCRESVWNYKAEWDRFTRRIGFWVDLHDPYITYETPYIESLWNIIHTFAEKKLLYQAHRVVPFCTRCGTPISSHEVAQGYKTVTDTSVYVKFKVKSSKIKINGKPLPKDTYILAWTTTPWTLPGNVALAVGKDIRYVLAKKGEEYFIVAEELADKVVVAPFVIEHEFAGHELVGTTYEPLFAVKALKKALPAGRQATAYKVYEADFVTTTDGTGVVHTAVMYGVDDYELGDALKLPKVHTVTEQGKFIGVSSELDGKYVKDAATEQMILDALESRGLLLAKVPYEHEYPFCWRCWTPLLYYAKDSWFVRMSALNAELLANNETVNWVPENLKHGRFGQWLREAKDWAFSRERYWGTPLPIWMARDTHGKPTGTPLVIGSLADLDKHRADKPATFWVVRHGESEKNTSHTINGGATPSPLTDTGKAQAVATARALKGKFAAIISSPVQRAHETAKLIADELGIKNVVVDERLREIQLGPSLDGHPDADYQTMYPTYPEKFTQRPPDGESLADLKARVWGALQELNEQYAGKQVLLVSHEYPIWMMADVANGWSQQESIAEKEKRGDDFIGYATCEQLVVRNLPRDERGNVDMHRPYIDSIVLKRGATKLYRVPELCDVWFDSGSMPFAQWHWPFENDDMFRQQFPADFIGEAIDQTRGWFYTLLAVSTLLGKGAPYRNVLSYAHVLDEKGQKMSKSKGNIVKPDDVIAAVGVDAVRWYFYTVNNPGDSKLFALKEVRERLTGFIGTLENCVKFWELYASAPEARNFSHGMHPTHALDRWVLSRLHGLIGQTTAYLDAYDLTGAARGIERFVIDDLSQWWLRRSRKRSQALGLLRHVLLEIDKLIAPFVPFMAEDMHQRLHVGTTPSTLSVHLHDWPTADASFVDTTLEATMIQAREYISAGLALRKQENVKVRQPLASVTVPGTSLPADLEELIRDELNVKEVRYLPGQPVALDMAISPALRAEGWAREVMRAIQDMRKEAGLQVGDKVTCQWSTADDLVAAALEEHQATIARDTGLSAFIRQADTQTADAEKEFDLEPGRHLWLGIRK